MNRNDVRKVVLGIVLGGALPLALITALGLTPLPVRAEDHAEAECCEHEGEPDGHAESHEGRESAVEADGGRHEEHDGHDHGAHDGHAHEEKGEAAHAEHGSEREEHGDGHDHGGHAGERVELTPEQRDRIGLEVATAATGAIATGVTFPGEVILNPDRMVHVVPRAAGIVREVTKTLGDRVEEGEILAWIESQELAEAKLAFYAAEAEVGCCLIKVPRAQEIFESTAKLLALLEKEPGQKELRAFDDLEMGEYRGRLLTAYAEYQASRQTYERERRLRSEKITSGQELLEADTAFKKAREVFHAATDVARYETLVAYTEAVSERQVAEFEAVAAEKRLRLKGTDREAVTKLRDLVPKTAGLEPCLCDDPNCQEGQIPSVTDTLGADERFAWYALRAPFAGFVTEKHLTLGEMAGGEESVFTIADTSSVWVRFSVYQKDVASVKPGQTVRVDSGAAGQREGNVLYVSPVIDEKTRTAQARVVLENTDGTLRPGLYVAVHLTRDAREAAVVIPKSAVQVLDEKQVVFVEDGDGFEAVPVEVGAEDRDRIAVTSGLRPGHRYVARGGFELKAKIVSSGLGAHAGHGH